MKSYEDAFYLIAEALDMGHAQPLSAKEVFETQMLPRIKELVVQREALALAEAERDAERARGDAAVGDANEAEAQLVRAMRLYFSIRHIVVDTANSDSSGKYHLIDDAFMDIAQFAQAEQQEAKSPMAKVAEAMRHKAATEWANHPNNPARQEAQGAQAEDERERLSVTNILLDIVPGPDGMGHEVYAKSVEQVERRLCDLGDRIEDLTDELARARAALAIQLAVQVSPEPVAHLTVEVRGRSTKVDIEWPNGLHTTLPAGEYPLYTSLPAAAGCNP